MKPQFLKLCLTTFVMLATLLALTFGVVGTTPARALPETQDASPPLAAPVFYPAGGSEGQPALPFGFYATQVAAGFAHTCALTTSGGVRCWGLNNRGQLGDGTTTDRTTPVDVSGLTSGVSAIAAGYAHTCALTTSGGVKCWGRNYSGQLGDGTTTDRVTPVDVSGLTSGVSAIVAGSYHNCALTASGGIKCWGDNESGQLGDGTTTDRTAPVNVSGLTRGVSAIAAGDYHTCALTASGGLKCWGYNGSGRLGDGTTTDHVTPVDVSGLTSGVSAIAAGNAHTCALTASGGLKCWGYNGSGRLGDGTTTDRTTPVNVSGLTSGVSAIAGGDAHTCALTTSGGLKCWGRNAEGQLGDGTTTDRTTPVNVSGLTSGVSAIAAGDYHTCALMASGGIKCWGDNAFGQLGDGAITGRATPVDVQATAGSSAALAAGNRHTCALTTSGGVKCWGFNESGQLGDGTTTNRVTPVDVSGLTSGVSFLAAGNNHTCALTTSGGVKCWGYNGSGQLGDGTTTQRKTPVDVSGLTSGVSALAAGDTHTCALTTSGGVKCWGGNNSGQLGDGTTTGRSTPVDVSGLTSGVSAIAAGNSHTCALMASGGVKCWGWNDDGQLGDGTTTQRNTPVDVSGLTSGVSAIVAGYGHTCALTASGGLKCWGRNNYGQLGDGTTTTRMAPVNVSGLTSGVSAIAAGSSHTCALTASGGLKCWGRNDAGQLGDGTTTHRYTPVEVSGLTGGVSAISAGGYHTCALTASGGLKCWGYNTYGQLGDGTTTDRATRVQVSGLTGSPFPQLALSLTPAALGQAIHFTATLSGAVNTPTGTVQFTIDGANFGSPVTLSGRTATSANESDLAPGAHLIQAFYSGDGNTSPASSAGVVQAVLSPTISGNAGVAGATLSYTDVTPKTATADGSGVYSFTVSYGWTGTVTPAKSGYTFSPTSKSYTNVTANKTAQDYTAAFGTFGKTSPPNGATSQSLSPVLSWGASAGATSYEYCYSSVPGPCTNWNSVGTDTSVTLSGLAPGYTYYWQARAVKAGIVSEANAGTWWSFGTTVVPANSWPPYTPPGSATFGDAPTTHWAWNWIERLYSAGITGGCGSGNYCPEEPVTRAQMAIFLLRGIHGSDYAPPSVGDSTGFNDVPLTYWASAWIKQFQAEGITGGCGAGVYCPDQSVTRAQMAIFLLRAKHGPRYSPPTVAGSTGFGDVAADYWAAAWIKQLADEGITGGCGNGNYCPEEPVTRAQMAVFLVRAFGLP